MSSLSLSLPVFLFPSRPGGPLFASTSMSAQNRQVVSLTHAKELGGRRERLREPTEILHYDESFASNLLESPLPSLSISSHLFTHSLSRSLAHSLYLSFPHLSPGNPCFTVFVHTARTYPTASTPPFPLCRFSSPPLRAHPPIPCFFFYFFVRFVNTCMCVNARTRFLLVLS